MAKYNYKYLVFRKKNPSCTADGFNTAVIDVNHLNKRGINEEWNMMELKYPTDLYVGSLTETQTELRTFQDEPISFVTQKTT